MENESSPSDVLSAALQPVHSEPQASARQEHLSEEALCHSYLVLLTYDYGSSLSHFSNIFICLHDLFDPRYWELGNS